MPRILTNQLAAFALSFVSTAASASDDRVVEFSRDIQPILSNSCFKCHGPDEANRKAGLRLDNRAGAVSRLKSDARAIVPGSSRDSALLRRISTDDASQRMPPSDAGKPLTAREIATIKTWIDAGAEWSSHWAFLAPVRPPLPRRVQNWATENAIDLFVHRRLRPAGLAPEPQAEKETLIRRVTLDLTGLPPTVDEVDTFLADTSPQAYERLVDRLLSSARYGEQMARIWLDAARYADTHGLHLDNERSIWPYRRWVIDALNRNLAFDQFTIEQLAGDLLHEPTLPQRVATGFNRCNVTTSEGGSIDAEYYVRYAVDRVETTSTVWLGLTAGCAACHDHKFDPLTQKEFYQLFSYFYSLTERAMDGNALLPPPVVKVPSETQTRERVRLQRDLAAVRREIESGLASLSYTDPHAEASFDIEKQDVVWFDDELPEGAKPSSSEDWRFVSAPEHPVFSGTSSTVRTAEGLSQHFFTEAKSRVKIGAHDRLFAYVFLDPKNPPETIQLQFNDGTWEHRAFWGADKGHAAGRNNPSNLRQAELPETGKWIRLEVEAGAVGLNPGTELSGWAFTQFKGTVYWDKAGVVRVNPLKPEQLGSLSAWERFRQQVHYPALPRAIQKILNLPKAKRSPAQTQQLTRYYLQQVNPTSKALFSEPLKREGELNKQLGGLEKSIPSTLVMEDRKQPRQAHVLERGEYTLPREKVASRTPDWIAPPPPAVTANRLGLAQWLVEPANPLTARVTVNRFWQHYFGIGLVATSEDFGVQGERPSHPKLLDWLAVDFVESGWDLKRLQKMIVMSATYRQSSRINEAKMAIDPDNRLLSRGARFRLDAEVIRDQALAISGLLVGKIGGSSVRPYQPAGLWKPVGFGGSNTSVFKQDKGSKLYRRSMYTFWKRTSPPPSMTTFDAPNRETCQVRRARTNTPLQALVLMNDVQFFEAARKFAERIIKQGGSEVDQRITFAFRSVTARRPSSLERDSLSNLLSEYQKEFRENPDAAKELLSAGESAKDDAFDAGELASWTMIAHLLLNLNETLTKG